MVHFSPPELWRRGERKGSRTEALKEGAAFEFEAIVFLWYFVENSSKLRMHDHLNHSILKEFSIDPTIASYLCNFDKHHHLLWILTRQLSTQSQCYDSLPADDLTPKSRFNSKEHDRDGDAVLLRIPGMAYAPTNTRTTALCNSK